MPISLHSQPLLSVESLERTEPQGWRPWRLPVMWEAFSTGTVISRWQETCIPRSSEKLRSFIEVYPIYLSHGISEPWRCLQQERRSAGALIFQKLSSLELGTSDTYIWRPEERSHERLKSSNLTYKVLPHKGEHPLLSYSVI